MSVKNARRRLIVSVLLILLSLPGLATLSRQIRLLIPAGFDHATIEHYTRARARMEGLLLTHHAMAEASRPKPSPEAIARGMERDAAHGFHEALQMLLWLRSQGVAAQPGDHAETLVSRCRRLDDSPAIHLYLHEERRLAESALKRGGLLPRQVAWHSNNFVPPTAGTTGVALLRELSTRLLAAAESCEAAGHTEAADQARRTLVRLLLRVIRDEHKAEPPPADMVLLAAEKIPAALLGMGDIVASQTAGRLLDDWRATFTPDQVNLIPWTGSYTLARTVHDRMMGSMVCTLTSAVLGGVLFVACFVFGLRLLVVAKPDASVRVWRQGVRSVWLSGFVASSPVWLILLVVTFSDVPWVWVFSEPTLPAVIFLPVTLLVSTGLAVRLCTRRGEDDAPATQRWDVRLPLIILVAVVLGTSGWILLSEPPAWGPPIGILLIRKVGVVLGAASMMIASGWALSHRLSPRKSDRRMGRAGPGPFFAVLTSGLLFASAALMASGYVNRYLDRRHRAAFYEAARDPIADRLGSDWFDRYFAPAREAIVR